jgi:hypothetical protein
MRRIMGRSTHLESNPELTGFVFAWSAISVANDEVAPCVANQKAPWAYDFIIMETVLRTVFLCLQLIWALVRREVLGALHCM